MRALIPGGAGPAGPPTVAPAAIRVAYIMSRFPKLTETFVLNEILAVEDAGASVDIYPLLREKASVLQPGAADLVTRARYQPFLSVAILASQGWWLARQPRRYLGAAWAIIRDGWGSPWFILGGLAIMPKVAHAARHMADDGVSHVHAHFANHPATAGLVVHRLTGLPFSFTAHGSDIHKDRHMLCRKVSEAAFVVAVSRSNADVIAGECGPDARSRMHVIRCGVDLDRFRPPHQQDGEAAADPTRPVPDPTQPVAAATEPVSGGTQPVSGAKPLSIVAVGTLHEVKGQTHLVEACRRLVADGVDIRCELIGDGPDRDALTAQIRAAGLGESVRLLGVLPHDRLAERMRAADVLVAPSVPSSDGRREGLPVVLMEAMATGLAVVASDLSGIPELVEDGVTGLLTPPGDPAAIAAALACLAREPELRRRLAAAGRERVQAEYDQDASAQRLVDLFRRHAPVPGGAVT
jgi:colanic acid/amylovoran biosynthesis glycosyltransferase